MTCEEFIASQRDPRTQVKGLTRLRLVVRELWGRFVTSPAFINRRTCFVWSEPRKVYDSITKQYAYLATSEVRCERTTWCVCWIIPVFSYDHA